MKILYLTVALLSIVVTIFCSCSKYSSMQDDLCRRLVVADSILKAGKCQEAMQMAVKVREEAKTCNDHYIVAKSEDLIADIMEETVGGMDVVAHRLKAADEYAEADSVEAHRYAMIDVAVAYINADSTLRACQILDSLRILKGVDSIYIADCMRASLVLAALVYDYFGIHQLLSQLEDYREFYNPDAIDYACMAIEPSVTNEDFYPYIDSANSLVRTDLERAFVDYVTIRCMNSKQKYVAYKHYTDSTKIIDALQPKMVGEDMKIMKIQSNDYSIQAQKEEHRGNRLVLISLFVCIVIILLIISVVIYHKFMMRVKNLEIERKIDYIDQLNSELSIVSEEKRIVHKRVETLFRERWETLNMLCNEFFEKSDSEKPRISIINEIEKELELMRTPRKIRQIEDLTNKYLDDIVDRLRCQCPFICNDDIVFLTLIYAGFSPRAVCIFTGIKLKYYYTKRSRLIKRIESSDAIDRKLFVDKL